MVRVKPFAALRPPKEICKEVSARPYDVMNSAEAKAEAGEKSLLHITRPEIDFDPVAGEHEQRSYDKAVENFRIWKEKGWLKRDEKENYYLYAQTMSGRTQYGIILCADVEDYRNGSIKRHELTRKEKEDERTKHIRNQDADLEPVFFAYPDNQELTSIMARYAASEPVYDFIADEDGFGHKMWVIDDERDISRITAVFREIPAMYVADGHHRTAAAARVGAERKAENPLHTGDEEYNFFMAVCFPASQLKIIDYNRVVRDLNGLSKEEFIARLEEFFTVEDKGAQQYRPTGLHNFSMYLDGRWYSLTAKEGTYNDDDPVGILDVTVSSNLIFDRILNLGNLRTSDRIDFVGGIRGLDELQRRVDSGEMVAAFALYPVSMEQLIAIADSGRIMPPKATWFEPKLRSGLAIHTL